MPTLTQPQIEMVARAAGLPGDPKVWAAVAMAESSGSTTAKNPSSGTYGLWQIHPIHRKDHPLWTEKWLSDPVNNARAAAAVYAKQGWGAWEAYTSGAYKQYLKKPVTSGGTATQVDWKDWLKGLAEGPGGLAKELGQDAGESLGEDIYKGETPDLLSPLEGAANIGDSLVAVAEAVQKAGSWLGQAKNWVRVGYVAGGGLLVIVGVYVIASPMIAKAATSTPLGQTVKKLASSAKKSTPAKATPAKSAPAKPAAGKATGTTPKKKEGAQ